MMLRWISVSFLLLQCSAYAAINTVESWNYYDVSGNTAAELRQSINASRSHYQHRFDAKTRWQIRWQFNYGPTQNKCAIMDVQISATITYLLPSWPDISKHPDRDLRYRWTRFMDRLREHEQQHGQLVKAASATIERTILQTDDSVTAPAKCKQLEALADQRAHAIVKLLEKRQLQFDIDTNHGRTRGAVFP